MFGNHTSPFRSSPTSANSIQDSHQKLFGGDRNLATKDITGAQPRKFNKHVWGHFQTNALNSGVSYNPQQSKLLSPILGDNVQPLNRMIPNSSGMIFRSNAVASNSKLEHRDSSAGLQAFNKSQHASQSTQSKKFFSQEKQQQQLLEKYPRNSIVPTSQIREQNIFGPQQYSIQREPRSLLKPQVNLMSQSHTLDLKHAPANQLSNSQTNNYLQNSSMISPHSASYYAASSLTQHQNYRSPDSIAQMLPPQKEYQREMISSYELGKHAVQSDTPFIDESLKDLQGIESLKSPSSKNPIFAQNRNYGPDNVLTSSAQAVVPLNISIQTSTKQQQYQSSPRNQTELPPITSENNRVLATSESNQLPIQLAQQVDKNSRNLELPSNRSAYLLDSNSQQRSLPQQSHSVHDPAQNFEHHRQITSPEYQNHAIPPQLQLPIPYSENHAQKSNIIPINRDATTNSQYGTYLNYARTQANSPISGEKPSYESKRTQFMNARLNTSGVATGEYPDSAATPTQVAAMKRRETAIRRGFNIIGNYPLYNGNRQAYVKPIENIAAAQPNYNNYALGSADKQMMVESLRSPITSVTSKNRLAGVQNTYSEFTANNNNNNTSSMKQPAKNKLEDVKLFDAKALKNLSNVKIY